MTAQSPAVAGGDVFVGAVWRGGPGRADDPLAERRAAVVQADAGQHRGDQPGGPGIRRQTRADVVAGGHQRARVRAGRRRDRRRHLHRHRARARRQRVAGRSARVPAHAAGDSADHGVRPDPLQSVGGGRPRLRRRHRQRLPGDRRQDRPGDVRMDEHRSRGDERILRTGEPLEHRLSLRLLPPQLDQPRPRRQPADLKPQHVDRLQARRPEWPDPVAPGR